MSESGRKRILFGGYAPVHFLCFEPVYRRLLEDDRVEVFLTGGFREKNGDEITFQLDGFYEPFGVDPAQVLPLEEIAKQSFDIVICSHLSDSMFPASYEKSVQLFHGVSFKNLDVREKALRYDVLCLPGRYHAELYRKQGLIRPDGPRYLITGFAKTDPLVDGSLDRSGTLEGLGLDPARPTVLFAPTGEKKNALETMGREVISEIARADRWNLLVKPHDHPKKKIDWFSELSDAESTHMRLVRDTNVIPYLHAADLLMTDASSVAVEFTLLDRPLIFLDTPKLFKRVEKRAPALDLETYGREIGTIVKKPESVPDAIEESLASPEGKTELRQKMADHVFHRPGSATDRVVSVILHTAGLEPSLPGTVDECAPDPSDLVSVDGPA